MRVSGVSCTNSSQGQPIILVPLEGRKGDRPPDAAINWLKYLEGL